MKASALTCENCGAGLPPPVHQVSTCTYCSVTHHVGAPAVYVPKPEVRAWTQGGDLHAALCARADLSPIGVGVRHHATALADPFALDRAIWAARANASSTYGGSWSPEVMIGPPTVFPAHGDRAGAWAPLHRSTPVEWVEVSFAHARVASALRIYETNESGGVYAVVIIDDAGESLVYRRAPEHHAGEARLLEVALDPPRVVSRARLYIANDRGRSWTEIDSVSLIATDPLPEPMRARMPTTSVGRATAGVVALTLLAIVAIAAGIATCARSDSVQVIARPPMNLGFATPTSSPVMMTNDVIWSSTLVGSSSEFASVQNGATRVIGAPDVFPQHADLPAAWAPREQDAGDEWIAVAFSPPVDARALIWLETLNPGAVTRIDDLSDPNAPVTLWEGSAPRPTMVATEWTLAFPAARRIASIRIVLDTARVEGWNEIDAIGVVPAR